LRVLAANCPRKAIKRNATFEAEFLRDPDVLLIILEPNLTVETSSSK